ncbi:MAG: hypothetical protein WBIAU1_08530 [Wolbachia endosymbiont of Drosophila biauraria]|nr:MAG: hypothetical protein WBIAU1_08530 [Wolbachia endosymbiont of Drosophila biauraria]
MAEQGKEAASKYLGEKGVEFRAYYTETDNTHRVLNINLINYNRSEQTRISDILQQEKDIKELNIYCNKNMKYTLIGKVRKDIMNLKRAHIMK